MDDRWQLGSEFDWHSGVLRTEDVSPKLFREPYALFTTASSILLSFIDVVSKSKSKRRLHIPCFFCMEVVAKLQPVFEIHWYRDLPTDASPDFQTLQVQFGDIVLALNGFGIRTRDVWQGWIDSHDDIILIEDHTHDPFSDWAQQSTAHYVIASLRKTLPIPDGAIIWSPRQLPLPQPKHSVSKGAYQKLTAMLFKQAYLSDKIISKASYRALELSGEEQLGKETNATASEFTSTILNSLDIKKLREKRLENIFYLLTKLLQQNHDSYRSLFSSYSNNVVPFNVILVFKNHEIRNQLRHFLIQNQVYVAVHWQQDPTQITSNDHDTIDLSERILTIPADYRYDREDLDIISALVTRFFKSIGI
jgi:hypothetical protein